MNNADKLVRRYILENWLVEGGHRCDTLHVVSADAEDGMYGCDTGCDYVRFTAVLGCDCDGTWEYGYGEFGDLAYIIENLEATEGT